LISQHLQVPVLLRHRLLPHRGGFEGFGLAAAGAPPNNHASRRVSISPGWSGAWRRN